MSPFLTVAVALYISSWLDFHYFSFNFQKLNCSGKSVFRWEPRIYWKAPMLLLKLAIEKRRKKPELPPEIRSKNSAFCRTTSVLDQELTHQCLTLKDFTGRPRKKHHANKKSEKQLIINHSNWEHLRSVADIRYLTSNGKGDCFKPCTPLCCLAYNFQTSLFHL